MTTPYHLDTHWARTVRMTRARDKLRSEHGLTAAELEVVIVTGGHRLQAKSRPEIGAAL